MGVDYSACLVPRRRTFTPTSAQVAAFVEAFRASKWTHACFHRPAARLRVTVARDDRAGRERALPDPLGPEDVDRLRRPDALHGVDDELCILFDVFWSTECVPRHVFDELEDGDEHPPEDDDRELHERRILQVEDEHHPRYFTLELRVARDLVVTSGNNIDTPGETRCECGALLSYGRWVDDRWPAISQNHVRSVCAECGRRHDPAGDEPSRVIVDSSYERARPDVKPTPRAVTRLSSHLAVVLDFEKDWPVLPAGEYLTVDPDFLRLCESVFGEPFEIVNVFT